MRHLIPALVVTLIGFSSVHAAPAGPAKPPFGAKSLGEGGGYKHPDADVAQYFETKPKPEEKKPSSPAASKPAAVIPVKAEAKPADAIPSRPRPRPFALAKAEAAAAPSAPRDAAPSKPAAAEPEGALDSASEDARRDYEARLFGAAPERRRPELADPMRTPLIEGEAGSAASTGEGMLFVSLELDPQESGALRDAVAGLGAAAAFRPDARFQPMPGAAGSVRISGWLPASRLGDAIARPGVKRVEVERGSRPAGDSRLTAAYLLTLRVADPSRPDESIAEGVRELTGATGFVLERVLGLEKTPGGGATAMVSGTMPVSQLSRALGLPLVMKVASAPPASEPAPAADPSSDGKPSRKEGFLQFVMARKLWLVLITVLLALPAVGEFVKKGLSIFVPYR